MKRLIRVMPPLIITLSVLASVTTAAAHADVTGGLIIIPGSGSDLIGIRVRTSAGCPTQADAYYATVKGRGFPPDGQIVTSNTKASLSHSFGFDAYFMLTMRDYATRNHTTLGGRYDITVFCIDSFTLHDYRQFTGSMEFTTPTHYEALGAAKPIGPPPPPLGQAPDGSALPPRTESPPATTPSGINANQPVPAQPDTERPHNDTLSGFGPASGTARQSSAPTAQPQPDNALGGPAPVGHAHSQRYDATPHGVSWLALVGVVFVGGMVIAVASWIWKRRIR